MRSRLHEIRSFDQQVLQDQLLAILNRSPQTQIYASHRVTQIITQIMSVPLIEQLYTKIAELEEVIELLEEQNKQINYTHSKQSSKNSNVLTKYLNQNKQLQKQIKILKDVEVERNTYRIQIEQLAKDNQQLTMKLSETQLKSQKYFQQIEKFKSDVTVHDGELEQARKTVNFKDEENKYLREQLEKIKKICKQTKFHEIKIRKQNQHSEKQRDQLFRQVQKMKQEVKVQKMHRQNQRKSLHVKLNEHYKKTKMLEKTRKKLKKVADQSKQIKSQLQKVKEYYAKTIKSIEEQGRKNSFLIMDQIGEQVNKQLKELISQISKNSVQLRVAKQQLRIKDEIIQKLERVSTVQVMGNKQLQKELKSKKFEAESLRKQLKKNYEQSEIKLMGLENSYRHILATTPSYPVR